MLRPNTATRTYFGQNLTHLIEGKTTVANVCRDLGLNRTQVNRYLNGESFPRPDVLDQICRYFDVDARILTTPLADLQAQDDDGSQLIDHLKETFAPVPRIMLPDGFYEEWR